MKIVKTILYPGFENLKNNLELYKQEFLTENIVVFRNANLTYEEQEKVQKLFGTVLDCYPNKEADIVDPYVEDHSRITKNKVATENEILLQWHIEHPYYDNPIVAGFWNMSTFNIKNEGGKTLFVNSSNLFKMLSSEDQDFLRKCEIIYNKNHMPLNLIEELKEKKVEEVISPVISKHWLTQEPILRMFFFSVPLCRFENRNPTIQEKNKFTKIMQYIIDQVYNNSEIRMQHTWEKGDLVIPDLHLLIHAVTGGFESEDRKFTGMWSYKKDCWLNPRINVTPK